MKSRKIANQSLFVRVFFLSQKGVKEIKSDLGISSAAAVDPIGNFPHITDKHRSLTCKAIKANPELYYKYANVKTPMGFTFDQAIQAGLDAPHLGVGIVAGEPAAYAAYKVLQSPFHYLKKFIFSLKNYVFYC